MLPSSKMPTLLALVLSFLTCFNGVFAAFAVTGVPGATFPRRDIRSLAANYPLQWSLYIQALTQYQNMPQNLLTSYYQIGGIHGQPSISWDGVGRTAPGVGYCTHSMNIFPTWHRPYVALFEQLLVNHAKQIANTYPPARRAAFQQAARELRSPWLDAAANPPAGKPALPGVITTPSVSIETPRGRQTVRNPLFSYRYHPLQSQFYASPWNHWPVTLRWPTSAAVNARSQNGLATATFARNRAGQKANIYRWFTNCKKFLEMSNDRVVNHSPGCTISLESIHNNVHVWMGGTVVPQGHMTVVPYSGHEPSFMLHHTWIDRLFAMWQGLYPNLYVPAQASAVNTFTIRKGSVQTANSPLKPFARTSRGDFWNSNQVRNWRVFHYTYPEFLAGGNTPAGMRAIVNRKYGNGARLAKRDLLPGIFAANSSSYEYIANIATTRYQLNGTYMVYMFFEDPTNADPGTWAYDPNLIGSYGVFSEPNMEDNDAITTSSVTLTDALADRVESGLLSDLSEAVAVPFLAKNLQWKVVGPQGTELNPADVPNFEVSVVASTLPPITNEEDFPEWSAFIPLADATKGKPGGLGDLLNGILDTVGDALGLDDEDGDGGILDDVGDALGFGDDEGEGDGLLDGPF